jgi:RHS repeat-associated protein
MTNGFDNPTLVTVPRDTLVAVWRNQPSLDYSRLSMSVYPPFIKRYFAGGQQIAMRHGDALYYTLSDPSGTSMLIVDSKGITAGHVLYDPYGGVLESDLSVELAEALAGTGSLADPAVGLVHLGQGRWYDPGLGRPLQPDPVGGPPSVPQALNRYAATAVGQPGVAEAVAGDSFLRQLTIAARNQVPGTLTGIALDQVTITTLEKQVTKKAIPTAWGLVGVIQPPTKGLPGLVTRFSQSRFGQGLARLPFVGSRVTAYYVGRNVSTIERMLIGEALEGSFGAGETIAFGTGSSVRLLAREITYVDDVVTKQVTKGLGRVGIGLNVFTVGLLSGGIQFLSDHNNPYLTGRDKAIRAGTSAILGGTATGIGLVAEYAIVGSVGGPVGIGVAVVLGVGFELWLAPVIFEATGAVETRELKPLN